MFCITKSEIWDMDECLVNAPNVQAKFSGRKHNELYLGTSALLTINTRLHSEKKSGHSEPLWRPNLLWKIRKKRKPHILEAYICGT